MKLIYHLSDAARQRMFVESGRDPGQVQALEIDPTALSSEDRALLVAIGAGLGVSQVLLHVPAPSFGGYSSTNPFTLDASVTDPVVLLAHYRPQREAGLVAVAADVEQQIAAAIATFSGWQSSREPGVLNTSQYPKSPRRKAWIQAHAAAVATAKAMQQQETVAAAAADAERAAAREQREADRAAWIQAHGSSRLKKCLDGGYDCQRQYVIERAALEFPGYVADMEDAATWKERSGPSEAALDEAARVDGLVVWLTNEPRVTPQATDDDGDYAESFTPGEAVVIRAYLGKYDLVRGL